MQSLTPEQREKWHLVLHEVPVEQGTLSVVEEGEPMANTHSHLTLSDRTYIEQTLERRMSFKGNTPTQGRQRIGTEDSIVRKPKHLYKAAYVSPALLQQDVREMYTALLPFLL